MHGQRLIEIKIPPDHIGVKIILKQVQPLKDIRLLDEAKAMISDDISLYIMFEKLPHPLILDQIKVGEGK